MLTLDQLITPVTEDEALETSLTVLGQLGFQATSWQDGAWQLTLIRLFCKTWATFSETIAQIAAGGFTTLAERTWLVLLARYAYNIEALEPQSAIGQILLTSSAGAPVHTWVAGDIIVADAASGSTDARSFTCTEGGTLGPSSSISIEFQADIPGTDSNIAPDTELFLWTPLVGVTATCPALVPDSNTWITTPGEDEETAARLAARCMGRWDRLTYGNTDGAYRAWALEALPALTRVSINRALGDGTVTLVGATALGALSAGQCTTIEDYLNGVTDGVGRRPINDVVGVDPAVTVTTPALDITAYVLPSAMGNDDSTSDAAADIETALLAYFGSIPIGGTILTGTQGRVLFSKIVGITQEQDGVKSALFSISSDILLNQDEIYVPTITVTLIQVSPT